MKLLFIFILIMIIILQKKIENFNVADNLYKKCCDHFGCDNPICYNYLIYNSKYNPLARNTLRNVSLGEYPNEINDNKYNHINPILLNSPNYLVLHRRFYSRNKWSYFINKNNKLIKVKKYDNIEPKNIKYIKYNNNKYYF